jgi:MFS family permease
LLRGNVLWLSIVSLLNDISSEMIYPLLGPFLITTLRASATFVGVIEGAAETVSSLIKLASGWVSDRFRRRPFVIAGYSMSAILRPAFAIVTAPWHVLTLRIADRTGKGIRTAARDALLAESVSPDVRGTAFGIHRAADHLGAAVGPLLAFGLLLLFDDEVRPVFAIAAIPGIVAVILLTWKVREARAAKEQIPSSPANSLSPEPTGAPQKLGAPFLRYLVVIIMFTLGNASDMFLLIQARELGVPISLVAVLWSVHHVSKATFSVPGGMIADRFGPRRTIAAGWLVYAFTYFAFAFAYAQWHIWALFLVYGLFHGLTESPEKALVAQLAPAQRRGAAFGAYHAAIGIAALPASALFGFIWDNYGASLAFLTGAGFALAATVLLPLSLTRSRPA